jgi:serine/threonine protein kinase
MSQPPPTFNLCAGDVLAGKYRIERVIGSGGMGKVVAARHIELDERVAIKFLLPDALGSPEAQARFAREARASVKIKSEHVARTLDVGRLDDVLPYIVMEYLEGTDLGVRLREHGPLSEPDAVTFVLQTCEGLADAHALGIVHRDLKPSNLFVVRASDGTESVKILDFGISKLVAPTGSGADITRTLSVVGTPVYMSPEQMESARNADARSDIWALGATLYELLTGRPPFEASSIPELCSKVLTHPTPSVRLRRAEIPAELDAVVIRCLAKAPEHRYQDVAELARALVAFAPPHARYSAERAARVLEVARSSANTLESVTDEPARRGVVETQDANVAHQSPANWESPPLDGLTPQLTVIRQDAGHVVLCYANLFLLIWRGTQQPEICATAYDLAVNLAVRTGVGKVGVVSMVAGGARAPSPAARAALARLHDDPERVVHRSALVVPSTGFIAAIIRSVTLSFTQRASRRGVHKIFRQVEEALAWVTEGLPTPTGVRIPVQSVLLSLRNHLDHVPSPVADSA